MCEPFPSSSTGGGVHNRGERLDEEDPVEKYLESVGCLEAHYQVQECMVDHKDWRKCQGAVQNFKKCIDEAKKKESGK